MKELGVLPADAKAKDILVFNGDETESEVDESEAQID